MPIDPNYETVIGLEVHSQLRTKSKIFCGCPNKYGSDANTQICHVCAGFPGVLPVMNREMVNMAIKTGLAINGQIRKLSVFSRKNYFYPDSPTGYQISQYDLPIVEHGELFIDLPDEPKKRIGVTRIHMEVDAGKSIHEGIVGASWVDLNRVGTPLLEIVSEPDMRCSEDAGAYLKKLRAIVRFLDVCDGNMEEGSFRCDANVSVRRYGAEKFGTRAELKNLNSIRNVMRAIDFEVDRQIDLIESGEEVVQETRLWDANKNISRSMRSKEDAHDYRYFPEPDLPPLTIEQSQIDALNATLPELPDAMAQRFQDEMGLSEYDAGVLTACREMSTYFEEANQVVSEAGKKNAKATANWVTGELLGRLNKEGLEIDSSPVSAQNLGKLVALIQTGEISGKIAKKVFTHMFDDGGDPQTIVAEKGLKQVTDSSSITAEVEKVLEAHPDQVEQYRGGKTQILGFLVGKVMQATRGKANPAMVNTVLKEKLG
ncbi:MAG: Asp-tRNA(Asn)/Glu-tRNA(Gln) amidotransferase subunit GatB [Magnetococcales bacterium]|nr:Asp-tRNA(Asn)/Glu-tRNA(Gln) amidotransferase subunit GatB [Magnetococcales bacterium]